MVCVSRAAGKSWYFIPVLIFSSYAVICLFLRFACGCCKHLAVTMETVAVRGTEFSLAENVTW